MNGYEHLFNDAFFFIMNVAIGGNWPGDPDETTPFLHGRRLHPRLQ